MRDFVCHGIGRRLRVANTRRRRREIPSIMIGWMCRHNRRIEGRNAWWQRSYYAPGKAFLAHVRKLGKTAIPTYVVEVDFAATWPSPGVDLRAMVYCLHRSTLLRFHLIGAEQVLLALVYHHPNRLNSILLYSGLLVNWY